MTTRYVDEIRDKVRVYLHGLGRVRDANSIGENTSMDRLRVLSSSSSVEEMYTFFDHTPIITNPEGNPATTSDLHTSIPCYLLFGEEGSITTTRFASGEALVKHIGLDDGSSCAEWSIQSALRGGGCRLRVGKYLFAITRESTPSIESIPLSRNNNLNIRIAGKILGKVPSTCVTMFDIAKHLGVKTGKGVNERLCKHLAVEYQRTNGDGNPDAIPRHTALTNLRTRVVYEFRTISEAARYLKVNNRIIRDRYPRETIPFYGDRYSIEIDYTD